MAIVPIRLDRTSKPPIGTPLRSDGHWSVQGLVGAWAFNEGAGSSVFNSVTVAPGFIGSANTFSDGLKHNGNNWGGCLAPCKVNLPKSTYILDFILTSANGNGYNLLQCIGYRNKAIVIRNDGSIGFNNHYSGGGASWITSAGIVPLNRDTSVGITFDKNTDSASFAINGVSISSTTPSIYGVIDDETGMAYHFGEDEVGYGFGLYGTLRSSLVYEIILSPQQIASLSANPWQIYEPETVWVDVGGGAEAALFAGTIYGQSTASAQLSTAITIASQVVAAGSISGGIDTAIRLATSTQGSASASALLTTAIRVAASAQGYGASTADLSTTIALAADILAAGSASGALSTAIRFGGALSGSSTTTAALTNAITMAAQAAGLGAITGQLAGTVAAALFAGTISGSSSASANLSTAVVLAAAAQGSATAQAALSTALELAAQVNGIGAASGALGADISGLAGSLHGSSEAQATLSTAIYLMGIAAGQCAVVGRLAEPVEILAQLRVMASDPLALSISVRDPLALRVTVH